MSKYIDKVTIERIALLHPAVRQPAREAYDYICTQLIGNATIRFQETLRTFEVQRGYYEQGRSKPGKIITNAEPGLSYHQYGLAIDFVLLVDKDRNGTFESASWDMVKDFDDDRMPDWLECVAGFKKFGFKWGGDWKKFKDNPHVEMTFGYSVRELLERYKQRRFIVNTNYVVL